MILVFAETQDGKFKRSAFEVVTFGVQSARELDMECVAVVIGKAEDPGQLGAYGVEKVLQVIDDAVETFDDRVYAAILGQLAQTTAAKLVVLPHSSTGKALLGRLAVKLEASSASSVQSVKRDDGRFVVQRPAFSGKAIAHYTLGGNMSVVTLMSNAIQPEKSGEGAATVEQPRIDIPERTVVVRNVERVEGRVPLPEASLVVSAGRGMKDPSNWDIIEELAEALGASTACSRPVADSGWRPHHEHVGQTGLSIRPNLYLAIGISGAIQHLAGVNNSKVIVVINKDPEAPFFKSADYGVQADLFDVVPRLTEAVKRFKNQ